MAAMIRFFMTVVRTVALPPLHAVAGILTTFTIPTFRALAGTFLIVAAVALASDIGPITSSGAKSFHATIVVSHWQQIAPSSLDATVAFFTKRERPWVWDAFSAPLRLPTFVFFTVLGAIFGYLGRRRHRVNIFVN